MYKDEEEESLTGEEGEESNEWSDSSIEDPKSEGRRPRKKKSAARSSNSLFHPRLYAIAWRRGDIQTTRLYLKDWDEIEFPMTSFSKSKFKRVKSEEEERTFIQIFFKAKGIEKTKWIKDGGVNYPKVSHVC